MVVFPAAWGPLSKTAGNVSSNRRRRSSVEACIEAGTSSREITKAIDTAQARELINRREAARLLVQLDAREER